MYEEKELELSKNKIYQLPEFEIIKYKSYHLAIAANIAKWVVLCDNIQLSIFNRFRDGHSISDVMNEYKNYEEDIIYILTQLEAKQIENTRINSVFQNNRLHLHLTNKCNLSCPHCYMNSGRAYTDELSIAEINNMCIKFRGMGGTDVSLTGGEPTARDDFFDIVECISNCGLKISLFTNGFLWNEEMVERFSNYNVEGVQISIDGYDEDSNAKVRGKGVFKNAVKAIELFAKHKIYVKVAVTPSYESIRDHKDEYIRFSKNMIDKYGEDAIEFNYSYFLMPGRNLSIEYINSIKDNYYELVDEVVTSIYGNISEDSFVSNIFNCVYDSCGYGGLNIMANGDVYFCDRIPDSAKITNIRESSFEEVYKLCKIAEKSGKIDNFKPCNDCELKYICGGGCRAEHFRDFTMISDMSKVNFNKIPPRICSVTNKEKFYELMIKTNERFYC